MATTEIRICGFGGQGIILAGYVVGKAAAVMEGRHATFNQSYGPEARGSACGAQVILSDEPVSYPYVRETDVLVAMSQDGYRMFVGELKKDGALLIDDSLVTVDPEDRTRVRGVPATRIAEKLGKRIMANMVMVGFFAGATGVLAEEAAREAIRSSVPSGTEEINLAAFDAGYQHAVGQPAGAGEGVS